MSVPDPLSVRLLRGPFDSSVSVIVDGPLGAVELQIRPALLELPGGGMSIEYHSRQPMPGAETGRPDCEVLDGAECYHDGITGGTQADFEPWFSTRDGQSIVDELVRRHQATTWTHVNDTAAIRISRPLNHSVLDAPARGGPCVAPARSLALLKVALDHPVRRPPLLPAT